jgi:hypothetical protein
MLTRTAEIAPETNKALQAAAETLIQAQGSAAKAELKIAEVAKLTNEHRVTVAQNMKSTAADGAVAQTNEAVSNAIAAKQTGLLGRTFGVNNDVAKATRAKLKTDSEDRNFRRVFNQQLEQRGEGGQDGQGGQGTGH